jgi:hypothetical protein
MSNCIEENITREEYSHRGGGCELDLSAYGYEDEFLSAYQNYLGGGMLGAIDNSCTVEDWRKDEKLVKLSQKLRDYFVERMYELDYIDEYNEALDDRPVSYPGL